MKKYTNKKNLSPLMQGMIEESMNRYDPGDSDYSTTTLIDSPRVVNLKRKHKDEIEEDVSDLIAAFLGNAVHDYLEQLAPEGSIVEKRLFANVNGIKISGQVDIINPPWKFWKKLISKLGIKDIDHSGQVGDYKTVKVGRLNFEDTFKKWEQQLNINAWLAKKNGYEIGDTAFIEYFLMDWHDIKAETSKNYPQAQQGRWEVKLWPEEKQLEFIKSRIILHELAKDTLPFCSYKDQWKKDDVFKLKKKGRKSSLKNEVDFRKLMEWGQSKGHVDATGHPLDPYYFETVEGEYTRCAKYCSVAPFCEQWKKINGEG